MAVRNVASIDRSATLFCYFFAIFPRLRLGDAVLPNLYSDCADDREVLGGE